MPPEYVTREEYMEGMHKLKKEIQEQRARDEERQKLINRLWMERVVYISIIIGSVSILTTLIVMR